jgi:hypothetical protein
MEGQHLCWAYEFGERAWSFLRRADELSEHYAEVLTAIREHIRSCEEIIADCKTSVDRIERRLPGATAPVAIERRLFSVRAGQW